MNNKKFRIAMWTPLPPLKTGIADYIVELLPYLNNSFDLEIFVDDNYQVETKLQEQYKVFPYPAYTERNNVETFDLDIYQMGNNQFHIFIYEQAIRKPGLVVLHDLSLSFVLYHYYAGMRSDLESFKKELVISEGQDALTEFNHYYNKGDQDGLMNFFSQKHMLQRLINRNYAMISHLEYGVRIARAKYHAQHAYSMYLGSPDPFDELSNVTREDARRDLGLPTDRFVIGSFGHLQANKQNDVMVRALAKVRVKHPNALLAFVGEINPANHYDKFLVDLIKKYKLTENIRVTGFVSRDEMQKYYIACDAIVNLRYPSFGQMSATLSRGIATGKPAIITDLPEWDFFPEDFCWRVPPEDTEGNKIAELINQLIENPELTKQRGQKARQYFLETGTSRKASQNLGTIIEDVILNVSRETKLEEDSIPVEEITLAERIGNAFQRWDASRAGDGRGYFLNSLQKIPIVGSFITASHRLFHNFINLREIRRAEWNLNNVLQESIAKLEFINKQRVEEYQDLVHTLQEITTTINNSKFYEKFEAPYQAEPVRILEDPLGLINDYDHNVLADLKTSDDEQFYIEFERAFRGSPELIYQRQQRIMKHIQAYTTLKDGVSILDIGCGGGEFLELLTKEGYHPVGVDTNQKSIKKLQQKNLDVYAGDIFTYLQNIPDGKFHGITAFHVIEHLEHTQIMALLELAYHKLVRGGFIYLETPNPLCPESLGRFYTDPTHVRPIQPFQLSFMLEYNHFTQLKVLFQEPMPARGSLASERWITLYQDFGVLALKEKEKSND